MTFRTASAAVCLATLAFAAGCNGPTKAGKEARADAQARLDSVSSNFTYQQALQDFEAEQLDLAMSNIERAIMQAPSVAKFHVLRGRIFMESNRLERAIESYDDAIEQDGEYAEAYYFSGIVYQRWLDDEQAFEKYFHAWELEPDRLQYLMAAAESLVTMGELDRAEELVLSKIDYFEHEQAMPHLLGQIAMLRDDPAGATRWFNEARLLDPDNAQLLEELAWAQYDAEQYGACIETIKLIASTTDLDRDDLMHLEARCLVMMGRTGDAHRLYTELTRNNAGDAATWVEFGTLAWELEDFRRVAQCGVRAIALAPDRFEGYMLKGLYERHEGRFDEAITQFQMAAERTDTVLPVLLLGRTLEESGNMPRAIEVYAQAIRMTWRADRQRPDGLTNRGRRGARGGGGIGSRHERLRFRRPVTGQELEGKRFEGRESLQFVACARSGGRLPSCSRPPPAAA
jgi:tetratricopeptide (TPR) repeat protein